MILNPTKSKSCRTYAEGTDVVELGLRWDDLVGLDSEPVEYKQQKDPREYLAECGATEEEQILVEGKQRNKWFGRRVEINAMTSGQLIEWLKKKLKEHGVKKVIPEKETLLSAYRRAIYLQKPQAAIEESKEKNESDDAPKNLRARVKKILSKQPDLSWDEAVWNCADEDSDESEE